MSIRFSQRLNKSKPRQIHRSLICSVAAWLLVSATGSVQALSESQFTQEYIQRLHRFMQNEGEQAQFTTKDGVVIRYQRFDRNCNQTAIVILPGWSEPYLKYAEVIYDLRSKHYCVYAMDYRGQGLSSREVDKPQMTYVKDFSYYVRDFAQFYQRVVVPGENRRIYLLAHSMGGLVAALYSHGHPDHIDGIIMIAPMIGINTGAWPQWLAYRVASALDWLGYGQSYVFGHGPWQEQPFAGNRLTHSVVRYEYGVDLFRRNKALVIGGVSNRWLKTSMEYGEKALRMAPQLKNKILMFEAQQDSFVLIEPMRRFCQLAPRCERVFVSGSKHELLMETDSIRDEVFAKIYSFIDHGKKE